MRSFISSRWLKRFLSPSRSIRRAGRCRPWLEALEDRRLLTTYVVANTGDNGGTNPAPGAGTGTLRQAIVDANDYGAAAEIEFQITNDCKGGSNPALIEISTPFPNVAHALTIDGYTQSGAAYNTSSGGFDAVLCVGVYTLQPAT